MMDAVEIVMKIAMAYSIDHRIIRENWHVCVNVHDDLRTKLAHEPLLIWFFVPILHANKYQDNDFWQMMLQALAIVRW